MKAPGVAYPQYVADLPAFRLYEGSGAALIEVRYRCSGLAFLEKPFTDRPLTAALVNLALTAADSARGSKCAAPDRQRPRVDVVRQIPGRVQNADLLASSEEQQCLEHHGARGHQEVVPPPPDQLGHQDGDGEVRLRSAERAQIGEQGSEELAVLRTEHDEARRRQPGLARRYLDQSVPGWPQVVAFRLVRQHLYGADVGR